MSEVETSIDIAAPPGEVWAMAMDPARLSEWVTIHRRLDDHSDGRLRAGYEMEQTLCLRGVNFKVHWELVRCEHPFHAEWHGRGPARSHAETEYRLTANDSGGTHFEYQNEFKPPGGFIGTAASRVLVGGQPEREANRSLQQLKALLEQ